MPSGKNHDGGKKSVERLKEKWFEFTDGLFLAIAEEEMRICREELDNHLMAYSRSCEQPESAQRRGGLDG